MSISQSAVATIEVRRSLATEMAEHYGMEPGKFLDTIKATVFPSGATVSNEQLAAFMVVAKHYDLNPFIREIYAFPGRGNGIVPVVSIDGWATLINRQKNLDGIQFEDHMKDGKVFAITCRMFRKDRQKPTEVTEYLSECFRETEPWKKWPVRMLRHKSLIQCARYAFSLSGVYDEDEAERTPAERPGGRLELEQDSALIATPEKAAQIAPSEERPNAEVFFQVGPDVTVVSGRTVSLKDALPKIGARWDEHARVWRMPASRTQELVDLCAGNNIVVEEI